MDIEGIHNAGCLHSVGAATTQLLSIKPNKCGHHNKSFFPLANPEKKKINKRIQKKMENIEKKTHMKEKEKLYKKKYI